MFSVLYWSEACHSIWEDNIHGKYLGISGSRRYQYSGKNYI